MKPRALYNLSKSLRQLSPQLRIQLQGYHAYRYSYFVDNSSRGLDCTYARATARFHEQEQQQFLDQLIAMSSELSPCNDLVLLSRAITLVQANETQDNL